MRQSNAASPIPLLTLAKGHFIENLSDDEPLEVLEIFRAGMSLPAGPFTQARVEFPLLLLPAFG